MKKVQNAKGQERALDELYRRYEDRGMTYERGAAEPKKHENGVSSARRYMTDGDFADQYRANREYAPEANVELESTILLQKIDRTNSKKKPYMKSKKNDIKKKLKAEADRNNPKGLAPQKEVTVERPASAKKRITSDKIKAVAKEAVKTWVPIEERNEEKIIEGSKTKIPTGVILAILVITISLLMIVGSAVLLGSAQREQDQLERSIEDLDFKIDELNTELNKKNEDIDIPFFAEEVLGMINQEHVNAEYIDSNKTDGVEKQNEQKASWTSLINWILQNLK